jgi:hypothetical protein
MPRREFFFPRIEFVGIRDSAFAWVAATEHAMIPLYYRQILRDWFVGSRRPLNQRLRSLRLEVLENRTLPTIVVPQQFAAVENTAITIGQSQLVAGDSDNGEPLAASNPTTPANATLVNNNNGTFTFTPNNGYTGSTTFNYTVGAATPQTEVTAADGAAIDQFGESLSVSGDTAVIGANNTVNGHAEQGAAYVFVLSGGAWSQQAELTAADGTADDNFGTSVSVNGDTAVIGADNTVNGHVDQGVAYVFVRSGSTWSRQAELTAADGTADDYFGTSVSVDGDTAVIGAGNTVNGQAGQGAAYVLVRSGSTWTQQAEITAFDGAADDFFGNRVSVSGDTAVIGADSKTVNGHAFEGAAYVFVRSGSSWSQQGEFTAADGAADDYFGLSVSVSGDTAIIGAEGNTVNGHAEQGAAYVFVRSGSTWSLQAELTAADGTADDYFGTSVSVSGDTAVIGAYAKTFNGHAHQGAAYVFVQSGSTWSLQAELTAADGTLDDFFGNSVSVSGDIAFIGADEKTVNGNAFQQGAAYLQQIGTATATATVDVNPPIVVAPATLPIGAAGSPYVSPTFTASGGSGSGYSLSESGPLPSGLTFNTTTAQFVGTPTQTGTFPGIVVTATDALGESGSQTYSLTVNPALAFSAIGPQTVGDGNALSFTVATQGGNGSPAIFSLGTAVPAGASINSQTGLFTWTPSEAIGIAPGVYTVTVRAAQTNAPAATATFTITVGPSSTNQGSGMAARQTMALGLTQSAEYYTDFITAVYQKYLGRAPDASGLAYWLNLMQNQGFSDEHLEAGFIGSTEYINDHGGAGAGWITGMYVDLLGRTPSQTEVQYWLNQLAAGESTTDIAYGFAASQERESERVEADYQQYLGRSASATEVSYWVNSFLNGGSNEQVIAGFLSSQEYYQAQGDNIVDWLFADYRATLNREPDNSGYQYWLTILE